MPIEACNHMKDACHIHDVSNYTGVGEKVRMSLLVLEPKRSGNLGESSKIYKRYEKRDDLRMLEKAVYQFLGIRKTLLVLSFLVPKQTLQITLTWLNRTTAGCW